MGKHLAKLPQQRVRAPENHPTIQKLEKLFDYMDELGLEFYFDIDRINVIDEDRPKGEDWEIRDIINSDFLVEIPCYPGEYKLTRTTDISPREAQTAPAQPITTPAPPSGLNHFKAKPQQKKKKRPILAKAAPTASPSIPVTQTIPPRTPVMRVVARGKR